MELLNADKIIAQRNKNEATNFDAETKKHNELLKNLRQQVYASDYEGQKEGSETASDIKYTFDLHDGEAVGRFIQMLCGHNLFLLEGEVLFGRSLQRGFWIALPSADSFTQFITREYALLEDRFAKIGFSVAKRLCNKTLPFSENKETLKSIFFYDGKYNIKKGSFSSICLNDLNNYRLLYVFKDTTEPQIADDVMDFLLMLTNNDKKALERLQMALGFTLFNFSPRKLLYILGGQGGGRSLLFKLIERCFMPESVSHMNIAGITKEGSRLTHLMGKHLILCANAGDGLIKNSDTIASLVNGDGLNTNVLYSEGLDFYSRSIVLMGGDNLPKTVAHGEIGLASIMEVIRLADYCPIDIKKENKILKHSDYFLSWVFVGAKHLYQNEFNLPESPYAYADANSVMADFVANHLEDAPSVRISSAQIIKAFAEFAKVKEYEVDRTILHTLIRQKYPNRYKASVRIGEKVSSGYVDLNLVSSFPDATLDGSADDIPTDIGSQYDLYKAIGN